MQNKSIIFAKRFRKFSFDIIKFIEGLRKYRHYEIINQITKSATSIGANYCESNSARSRKELIGIRSIALREARGTEYWLELINDLELLLNDKLNQLKLELNELTSILVASINTNKRKLNSENI